MGRKQLVSSSVSEPATSDDDEEDAVAEFNRNMKALEDAEARHKAAKKKAKQQQNQRTSPQVVLKT